MATGESLGSQFELDVTLTACMANTIMRGVLYLENGASFHMTGNKDIFSDCEEKYLKQSIEFGDDERYRTTGIGALPFKGSLDPLSGSNM